MRYRTLWGILAFATGTVGFGQEVSPAYPYPETPRIAVSDTLHGTVIVDDYRWLEDGQDPRVIAWTEAQQRLTRTFLDSLPQRAYLIRRFGELWRYDDEGVPSEVLDGDRVFYYAKKKEDEKWTYNTMAHAGAPPVVLIDPNRWDANESLEEVLPSRDGRYLVFGTMHGGDENPVLRVMEVATRRILPDSVSGWKQYPSAWLPDNSGFYYTARPLKGTVPPGEEHYWHAAYLHRLGTPAAQDEKIFGHDQVKEYFHWVGVSEDGQYELFGRSMFDKNELYFRRRGVPGPLTPLATGMDARYAAEFIQDRIVIVTDAQAPRSKAYVTEISQPEREHWRELIPEDPTMTLRHVAAIAGHLYAVYEANAHTLVKIYSLEGEYLRDLPFPTLGTGEISGYWSKDNIWIRFSSFTYPPTTFKYDFAADSLVIYHKFPLDIDVASYTAEQVWYSSRDSTRVSMFLVHRKDLERNGANPTVLTGYGGFNMSMNPYFSTTYVAWLEAGGMVAIPNLRGGGEYGREWHEAGMRERKQNVFDDFIAAAEWLIGQGYTSPAELAIAGGSNGGLLVGAVAVQRPNLFRAVDCEVPLLDMVRYHRFGLANIWAEEYGSAEDPEQFRYLYDYSPYHHVIDGICYPMMLISASENDARVDPMHACKMVARLQYADPLGGPILLLMNRKSGHIGGSTLTMKIEQHADTWAFLMHALGMKVPQR